MGEHGAEDLASAAKREAPGALSSVNTRVTASPVRRHKLSDSSMPKGLKDARNRPRPPEAEAVLLTGESEGSRPWSQDRRRQHRTRVRVSQQMSSRSGGLHGHNDLSVLAMLDSLLRLCSEGHLRPAPPTGFRASVDLWPVVVMLLRFCRAGAMETFVQVAMMAWSVTN